MFLFVFLFFFTVPVFSNFKIDPAKIVISDPADMQTINVSNTSRVSVHYQIYVVSLSIKDGKEVEEPVKDFLIFPKILKLKEGDTRKIQLKYTKENDDIYERNFRVVLKQINTIQSKDHIKILFDFKIPIYVSPKVHTSPNNPVCKRKDALHISCLNPNPEHITLTNIRSGDANIKRGITILPKSEKLIAIPEGIKDPFFEFFYVDEVVTVENVSK